MSCFIIVLIGLAWLSVGAWACTKAIRYECDLTLVDAMFCLLLGSWLGPFNLIALVCCWQEHRESSGEPVIIAKKIER